MLAKNGSPSLRLFVEGEKGSKRDGRSADVARGASQEGVQWSSRSCERGKNGRGLGAQKTNMDGCPYSLKGKKKEDQPQEKKGRGAPDGSSRAGKARRL